MGLEELCNYTILWAGVIIAFGVPVFILAFRKYVKLPTEWLADEIGNCLKVQYSAVIRGGINCSGIRKVSDGWFKKMVNKL